MVVKMKRKYIRKEKYTQVVVTRETHKALRQLADMNKRSMLKQLELLVAKAFVDFHISADINLLK